MGNTSPLRIPASKPYLKLVDTTQLGRVRGDSGSHAPIRVLWVGEGHEGLAADNWELVHAASVREAHKELSRASTDVAVLPFDENGKNSSAVLLEFLDELRESHPRVMRIALSNPHNERLQMSATVAAHATLPHPCDRTSLTRTIQDACALQTRFHQARLQRSVGAAHQLPSPPSIYMALNAALRSPQRGLLPVVEVIQGDPSLAARVLHTVNSPALAVGRNVGSISQAVSLLGLERVRSLVVALEMTRSFDKHRVEAEKVQQHSFAVADLAARIAGANRSSTAFTAGLLHDIGKLVLLESMPNEYGSVLRRTNESLHQLELGIWGFSHAEAGAYLLGLWGLPLLLVETVANHHRPGRGDAGRFDLATVVHVADALVRESSGSEAHLDPELMSQPGAEQKLEVWRSLIG